MAGNLVKIRTDTGEYGTVAAKDLKQALAADAEVVSDQEFNKAALQKEYGGAGGTAAALGLGAARGATLGLSDVAASYIGGENTRKTIEAYQEANPLASIGGEVLGAAAPLLVSGGTSGAAEGASLAARGLRGAGSVVRGVDALGGLAERGVARLVGTEAKSIVGRGLQKGVALGARGAVEGAAYGAFQQLDEDVLGDKQVTAQKLFSAAGKGALFGGVLSAGLGFAGGVAERGLERGKGALIKKLGSESTSQFLEKQSAEAAFRSAGGGKKIATKAEKYAGGTEAVGKLWRDEAPALVGASSFGKMTREQLGEAAIKGMAREGEALGGILTKADEMAMKAGKTPIIGDLLADVERVKSSVGKHAGQEPLVARLDDLANLMKRITGAVDEAGNLNLQKPVSFQQWQALRRDADAMWGEAAKGGKTVFLDLRGEMEKSMVSKLEGLGADAKAYDAAKKKWQAFKLLDDATKNADAAASSNRLFSLTDTIAGSAGSIVGGAIGGFPGSLIGGAISSSLNKFARSRGDFVMSDALRHMSQIEKTQAVTKMVDTRIEAAIGGLLTRGKSTGIGLASKAVAQPVKRDNSDLQVLQAVHALASNPELMQQKLQEHAGDLHRDMPGVSAQYALVASKAVQYLAQQAPKAKAPSSTLQPHLDNPYRMSAMDRAKWKGTVRGVLNTMDVIDDLGSGKVDRFAIAAIKDFAPDVYMQMQQEVDRQSEELAKKLPLQKQAAVSNTFGVPVGSMFTPEGVAAYQATYAPAEAQQEQKPSMGDMNPSERASKLKSPTEEVATND